MSAIDDILTAVPIGRENRMRARAVWLRVGQWSPVTIRSNLEILAKTGTISMLEEPIPGGVVHTLYREPRSCI